MRRRSAADPEWKDNAISMSRGAHLFDGKFFGGARRRARASDLGGLAPLERAPGHPSNPRRSTGERSQHEAPLRGERRRCRPRYETTARDFAEAVTQARGE